MGLGTEWTDLKMVLIGVANVVLRMFDEEDS